MKFNFNCRFEISKKKKKGKKYLDNTRVDTMLTIVVVDGGVQHITQPYNLCTFVKQLFAKARISVPKFFTQLQKPSSSCCIPGQKYKGSPSHLTAPLNQLKIVRSLIQLSQCTNKTYSNAQSSRIDMCGPCYYQLNKELPWSAPSQCLPLCPHTPVSLPSQTNHNHIGMCFRRMIVCHFFVGL